MAFRNVGGCSILIDPISSTSHSVDGHVVCVDSDSQIATLVHDLMLALTTKVNCSPFCRLLCSPLLDGLETIGYMSH